MQQAIIIIPIYKSLPNRYEEISFRQCIKVLSKHSICIITFKELNIDWYSNLLRTYNINFSIECFNAAYFESISGYNRLMVNKELYQRFSDYKYMLIYQLDAYVFRDELDYWCQQGYDYIGAPWFKNWDKPTRKLRGAGNGGFSLRNIQNSLFVLDSLERLRKTNKLYTRLHLNKLASFYKAIMLFKAVLKLKPNRKVFYELITDHDYIAYEDGVWALNIPDLFYYKVASASEALAFSFETNPSLLYEMNGNKLPFGCHAWEKYEPLFWQSFIKYDE